MSKAAVFTFREIINTNEELQEELQSGTSLIEIAARYRIELTSEDVRGALDEMREELSEEEIGWYEKASAE
jgi:hypothetical protein